jgi:hypothetical protein
MSDDSISINGSTPPARKKAEGGEPARARKRPSGAEFQRSVERTIAPQLPPEHRRRPRGTEAERTVTFLADQIIGPDGTCFLQTAPGAPRFLGDRYQMLASQVAARGKNGAPGRIDPATVPAGELGDEEYRVLTERARYLNGLYDRMHPYRLASSWVMPWRLASAETGLLKEHELKERDALNAAIWATVFPEPTPAQARLDAMRANPIGTAYLVASGYDGGEPTFAQSVVFGLGSVVDQAGVGRQISPGPREPHTAGMRVPRWPWRRDRSPSAPPEISSSDLGPRINGGVYKVIYAYGEDEVVAIVRRRRWEGGERTLEERRRMILGQFDLLNQLRKEGLPTVEARLVTVDGEPALAMKRYAASSKEMVFTSDTKYLNERSIADLEKILKIIEEKQLTITDLQFLIGEDGRVVIFDPSDELLPISLTDHDPDTFAFNKNLINEIIRMARENIAHR